MLSVEKDDEFNHLHYTKHLSTSVSFASLLLVVRILVLFLTLCFFFLFFLSSCTAKAIARLKKESHDLKEKIAAKATTTAAAAH